MDLRSDKEINLNTRQPAPFKLPTFIIFKKTQNSAVDYFLLLSLFFNRRHWVQRYAAKL